MDDVTKTQQNNNTKVAPQSPVPPTAPSPQSIAQKPVTQTPPSPPVPVNQSISLIKTPFSQKEGLSENFAQKSNSLVSGVNSVVYGSEKPRMLQDEFSTSTIDPAISQIKNKEEEKTLAEREEVVGIDLNKDGDVPGVPLPTVHKIVPVSITEDEQKPQQPAPQQRPVSQTPIDQSSEQLPVQSAPVQTQPKIEIKPIEDIALERDENTIRKELDGARMENERLSLKKKSLTSELISLQERKDEIQKNRIELEQKELESERGEKEIEEKIRNSLSSDERKKLEKMRWSLEDAREVIEKERWQYDEALQQVDLDEVGIREELSALDLVLEKMNVQEHKLQLELRKINANRRKKEIEQKISEVEALREQVLSKQREFRDRERELHDSEEHHEAVRSSLEKDIKEIEQKEHTSADSKERHSFEQQRWALEKEHRKTQNLIWEIQEQKKQVENNRIDWSRRDEKFSDAIKKLKSEIFSL